MHAIDQSYHPPLHRQVRDALAKKLQFSVEEHPSLSVLESVSVTIAAQTLDHALDEAVVKVQAAFRGFAARANTPRPQHPTATAQHLGTAQPTADVAV